VGFQVDPGLAGTTNHPAGVEIRIPRHRHEGAPRSRKLLEQIDRGVRAPRPLGPSSKGVLKPITSIPAVMAEVDDDDRGRPADVAACDHLDEVTVFGRQDLAPSGLKFVAGRWLKLKSSTVKISENPCSSA
jgi:hypothetical protein